MENIRNITNDLLWVGANDRKLALFEAFYPVPTGVSYNSYILLDEKTVLLDTVDKSVSEQFLCNVDAALSGRTLDYLVINHMEPDHCSAIKAIVEKYQDVKIVCNKKTQAMIGQFFDINLDENRYTIVQEGDSLNTGKHNLSFVLAPMVHWPEVMVTYDSTDKILFSADAFGTFGAIDGNIFADEVDFDLRYMDEARRYYTNIVGKYGTQVQALLKKAAGIDIQMICPLHGFVWRTDIAKYVDKYQKWSTYEAEEKSALIMYASVYGNTQNATEILSTKLAQKGVKNIKMVDVSITHPSYIIADAFKYSHLVFASASYNAGIFVAMENLINDIVSHNLQNKTIALIENGSWISCAGKLMSEKLSGLKNCNILENKVAIKSSVKTEQIEQLEKLAAALVTSIQA